MMKILFVCNNLEIGGVQRALVNLLNNINEYYDIDLLLFNPGGPLMQLIPNNVKLVRTNKYLRLLGMTQKQTRSQSYYLCIIRGLLVISSYLFGNFLPRKLIFWTQKDIRGYDAVISYTQDTNDKSFAVGCNDFVLNKTVCKTKVTFVHCDFKKYGGNSKHNRAKYRKFSLIACVSKGCRDSFLEENPSLVSNTYIVKNCVDYADILKKANNDPIVYDQTYFNIVTVARLTKEKGILRALFVINGLIIRGYKVRWHIVGDGEQKEEIISYIMHNDLNRFVFLYNNQCNPYKYIAKADLFFIPSFHEAAPMVICEAQVLCVPILSTLTSSSEEMVKKTNVGYVCENSVEGIERKLIYIMDNTDELQNLKRQMFAKRDQLNNTPAIEAFKQLMVEPGSG